MLSIQNELKDKTLFITGATGFIGKILVVQILYEQPDVKRIYLMIQKKHGKTPAERLEQEIIQHKAFDVLRAKHGDSYLSFVRSKLCAIQGNLLSLNSRLDMNKTDKQKIINEVEIIIHAAADVKFDESIEIAVQTNALGAYFLAELAAHCINSPHLIHMSTAYVHGITHGESMERTLVPGQTPNDFRKGLPPSFDLVKEIDFCKQARSTAIEQLQQENSEFMCNPDEKETEEEKKAIEQRLIQIGTKRASSMGWQDTYAYSKALAEMVVSDVANAANVRLTIVRPSIVEGALSFPQPGWIEGMKVMDPLIAYFATGKLFALFNINKDFIFDVVPVDLVTSTVISCIVCPPQPGSPKVYQVATSKANPIKFVDFVNNGIQNTKENKTLHEFCGRIPSYPVMIPRVLFFGLLSLLIILVTLFCNAVSYLSREERRKIQLQKHLNYVKAEVSKVMYLESIFRPYTTQKWVFDSTNVKLLQEKLSENGQNTLSLDLKFDWKHWALVHQLGLINFELRPRQERKRLQKLAAQKQL